MIRANPLPGTVTVVLTGRATGGTAKLTCPTAGSRAGSSWLASCNAPRALRSAGMIRAALDSTPNLTRSRLVRCIKTFAFRAVSELHAVKRSAVDRPQAVPVVLRLIAARGGPTRGASPCGHALAPHPRRG